MEDHFFYASSAQQIDQISDKISNWQLKLYCVYTKYKSDYCS